MGPKWSHLQLDRFSQLRKVQCLKASYVLQTGLPGRLVLIRFLEISRINGKTGKGLDIGRSMNSGVRTRFPLGEHRDP